MKFKPVLIVSTVAVFIVFDWNKFAHTQLDQTSIDCSYRRNIKNFLHTVSIINETHQK